MTGKYSFMAPKEMFNNHTRVALVKQTDPNPRCGDCTKKPPGTEVCTLKNKPVKDYNKCDFFIRDTWRNAR